MKAGHVNPHAKSGQQPFEIDFFQEQDSWVSPVVRRISLWRAVCLILHLIATSILQILSIKLAQISGAHWGNGPKICSTFIFFYSYLIDSSEGPTSCSGPIGFLLISISLTIGWPPHER